MMRSLLAGSVLVLTSMLSLSPLSSPCLGQIPAKRSQPAFNLFSVEQDVEIGRQAAVEAENQLPLFNDPAVNRYLNRIVQ